MLQTEEPIKGIFTLETVFDHIFITVTRVESRTRGGVFLTNFKVFGNVVKHCLKVSAIPQGRLRADRPSALSFKTNPYKPYIFLKAE